MAAGLRVFTNDAFGTVRTVETDSKVFFSATVMSPPLSGMPTRKTPCRATARRS